MKQIVAFLLALLTLPLHAQQAAPEQYRLVIGFGSVCCGPDYSAMRRAQEVAEQTAGRIGKPIVMKQVWYQREGETAFCFPLKELRASAQAQFVSRIKAALGKDAIAQVEENDACPRAFFLREPCTRSLAPQTEDSLLEALSGLLKARQIGEPETVARVFGTCQLTPPAVPMSDGGEERDIRLDGLPTAFDPFHFRYALLRNAFTNGWAADLEIGFEEQSGLCVTAEQLYQRFYDLSRESKLPLWEPNPHGGNPPPQSEGTTYHFANSTFLRARRFVSKGGKECAAGVSIYQRNE
jgi:hypothetical protein